MEVNALVLDKDGRPLEGLTRDDFTGVSVVIRPAADAVTLTRKGDVWEGTIDVAIVQSLPNGRTFKTFASTVNLVFTDAQHTQMLRDGFSFDRMITLRPDSHRLHITSVTCLAAPSGRSSFRPINCAEREISSSV